MIYVLPFDQVGVNDVDKVGGKNSSLGEMISNLTSLGVNVPNGFATTADAYRDFLKNDGLDKRISDKLKTLDVDNLDDLAEAG
ncbi:phosphoenolpyruvate synthase, partial [Francisellaceae bacterium]|nr:phosphoenolpyruvate synthase [Francisellaceae bacterium]